MRIRVSAIDGVIFLLVLGVLPGDSTAQGPQGGETTVKPPAVEPRAAARRDWVARVKEMDDRELAAALAQARRVDRTGQALIKRRAWCRVAIAQAQLEVDEFSARPDVFQCATLLARPEVWQKLLGLKTLPRADMPAAFASFLREYRLDVETLRQWQLMHSAQKTLARGQAKLKEIEQQIAAHENNAPVAVLPKLDFVRGSASELLDRLENEAPMAPAQEANPTEAPNKELARFLEELTK